MHHNLQFPIEVGNPKRQIVHNSEQLFNFINANNGSSDLYLSVYSFSEFTDWHPDYNTTRIDRIYFDCDNKKKEYDEDEKRYKWVKIPGYDNMLKLHKWAMEQGIIHYPRLTGTAFDVIIATEPNIFIRNKKECIANAQRFLCKLLNIDADVQTIGDVARIHRIDHTYNCKSTARRFCIPLDPAIIYLGEKKIKEIAKNQRLSANNRYGTKYWDISKFDVPEFQYRDLVQVPHIEINEKDFVGLANNIPPCVKNLLTRGDLNWTGRRIVILCLRDNFYLIDEARAILRQYLTPKKFRHCVYEERQLDFIYEKEKYIFPRRKSMKRLGYCFVGQDKYCKFNKHGCLLYNRRRET